MPSSPEQTALSAKMRRVLAIAKRDGGFVSAGTGVHAGRVERVAASTLLALIRRGLLSHSYNSAGGVGGVLTNAGREAAS